MQLARRKRFENADVRENGERLMKAADEVFPYGEIDSGLAADRGVDLREKRGRNLNIRNGPHIDGGEEAAEIAYNASAEGDEQGRAVGPRGGKLSCESLDTGEAFVALARIEEEDGKCVVFGKGSGELLSP